VSARVAVERRVAAELGVRTSETPMEIRAAVQNRGREHSVTLSTDGRRSSLSVPAKAEGSGSSVNGGELLCLALATCYCNDLYREAALRGLRLNGVEVEALLRHTDRVAEVQNTVRAGIPVELRTAPLPGPGA
jgi:organic hydroperoxide reductase OsmC/OhrA